MDVERDPGAWSVLNREYHDLLSESAGMPKTAGILKALRNTGSLYIAYGLRRDPAVRARANDEHRAILEACRARDKELAPELVREHLIVGATLGRTGLADTREPSGERPR